MLSRKNRNNLLKKLKNILEFNPNVKIWVFGSYLTKKDGYKDIDVAFILKNESDKSKLNKYLKSHYKNSIIEEAQNYGGGSSRKETNYHFLLLEDSMEYQQTSIYKSITQGIQLY